jgi:hypothetical protein
VRVHVACTSVCVHMRDTRVVPTLVPILVVAFVFECVIAISSGISVCEAHQLD